GWPFSSRVGIQYAERSSPAGSQVVAGLANSDAPVVAALVLLLPQNVCRCEAPAMPGKTIGSSGRRWLILQEALNSGTRTLPAGTGLATVASYSASCLSHLAWS